MEVISFLIVAVPVFLEISAMPFLERGQNAISSVKTIWGISPQYNHNK